MEEIGDSTEIVASSHEAETQLAAAVSAHASDLAHALAGFFQAAGVPCDCAAATLREAADRAQAGQATLSMPKDHLWVQLSDAIAIWWRNEEYLDEHGRPLAIRDSGPSPSLDDLLTRTVDMPLRVQAKHLLRRTAAVELDGVWRLKQHDGSLPVGGGSESVQRLHLALSGMLLTFLDNQTRLNEPPILKNFDSAAHVRAFPAKMLLSFAQSYIGE